MDRIRNDRVGKIEDKSNDQPIYEKPGKELFTWPGLLKDKLKNSSVLGPYYNKMAVKYRYLKNSVRPHKSARVYIKKGISRMEFFKILNERKVGYVLLRWWENLPEIPEGEDMDILVWDEDRDHMNDLLTYVDNGTGMKCDIYTVRGSNNGAHKSLPYFQTNLAETLLENRVDFKGAFVPSPESYFASLSYHALFHKGRNSGLPGFGGTASGIEHNYREILEAHASELGIEVKISAKELFCWLKDNGYAPAEDTLSKLAEIKPELSFLQKRLFSDSRGGNLMVFVIRERLLKDGLLRDFTDFLKKDFSFDIIDIKMLNPEERDICKKEIRGGKWDKGPFRFSGGAPVAIVVAYDYHPMPLSKSEAKRQPRMTNKNLLNAKVAYRNRLNQTVSRKAPYNGVHSSDNEQDALDYISLLGKGFMNQTQQEVEKRRERYANRWSVHRVLSTNSISKVELINFRDQLAVKKTFRPGREKFLQREIFAAKELSKDFSFIPPLLSEGKGFLILPYLENQLKHMEGEAKKILIESKTSEILRVICSMHSRGIAYLNFTPESLIITPDNQLFCTGFSYLQRYALYSPNIEEAYEISGVPKAYPGDYPVGFEPRNSSYKKVWEPFLGSWKSHLRENSQLNIFFSNTKTEF